MNQTRLDILKNSILATAGLMSFAVGTYLIIQANLGVNPWDTFCIGLSQKLGILYGTSSIIISFTVIAMDLILKEKIGIGTILDAIVVGKTVDLLNWLDIIPKQDNVIIGIIMLFVGFFIAGFSQYLYMKAGLSCGPRDGFQIAIGRRLHMIPIGGVNVIILSVVLVIGWFLDGPIGVGTLISPFAMGFMQQFAFNLMKFEPKEVVHQDLFGSIRVLLGKTYQKEN
jgi:uncharacterized membrane protein YczE